jgi:hypothetical protein
LGYVVRSRKENHVMTEEANHPLQYEAMSRQSLKAEAITGLQFNYMNKKLLLLLLLLLDRLLYGP